MSESIIQIENLTKLFKLPHERRYTLKQYFINIFRRQNYEKLTALDRVSFTVNRGEFISIIGRNGSGKSTLLKLIAGILKPNAGRITVNGSLAPFLELGVGFQPDLTARDNVYLYGAILGLTRDQINEKFEAIFSFAELEKFVDQKLKNFSSGMQVRLAFSTAIQADADILLLDEVLAVGDIAFQAKCYQIFEKLKKAGRTILFVSHDLASVEKFSDRVIFLDQSKISGIGSADEMVEKYRHSFTLQSKNNLINNKISKIYITNLVFLDSENGQKNEFKTGEKIIFRIFYRAQEKIDNLIFGIEIFDNLGAYLVGINMSMDGTSLTTNAGVGSIDLIVNNNPFLDGIYYFSPAVADGNKLAIYDKLDKSFKLKINNYGQNKFYGSVNLNHRWRINKSA